MLSFATAKMLSSPTNKIGINDSNKVGLISDEKPIQATPDPETSLKTESEESKLDKDERSRKPNPSFPASQYKGGSRILFFDLQNLRPRPAYFEANGQSIQGESLLASWEDYAASTPDKFGRELSLSDLLYFYILHKVRANPAPTCFSYEDFSSSPPNTPRTPVSIYYVDSPANLSTPHTPEPLESPVREYLPETPYGGSPVYSP